MKTFKEKTLKSHLLSFIVMVIVGMAFNPMNILAYKTEHLYGSLTLFYSGLLMASNMIWAHEIVHYLNVGHINTSLFLFGVLLSITISLFLLRDQLFVTNEQWLKRMIGHHSTAITTTNKLLQNDENFKDNPNIYRLARDIVYNQKRNTFYEEYVKQI